MWFLFQHLVSNKKGLKTEFLLNIFLFLVLSDLDELKKTKEGARNAIKWMESEFKKGNRYMRSQRSSELLAMPLLKVPKKLGKID